MKKMNFLIAASLLAMPGSAYAQFDSLLHKAKSVSKDQRVSTEVGYSSPLTVEPDVASAEPKADPAVKDKFITRKDAHGHDYDAKTGHLICLDTPRKYKSRANERTWQTTKIPEGHPPNRMCISADRNWIRL